MLRSLSRKRPARSALLSGTLLAVAVSVAPAADNFRPAGRFDDRIRHLEGGPIVVEPREIGSLGANDALRGAWGEFGDETGGGWEVHVDERTGMPTLAAGGDVVLFAAEGLGEVDLDAAALRALNFLEQRRRLLGDWTGILEFDRGASFQSRNGHWQLVFRQNVDGVRVENARLTLHVKRGRLMMFGASHWGSLTTDGLPSIDPTQARKALDAYLGAESAAFDQVAEPQLTLRAIDASPSMDRPQAWRGPRGEGLEHVLLWRFRFREAGASAVWVGEVDAHDGSVRALYDATNYSSVRGGVFPVAPDGDCPSGGCEIAGFPMPFADYTEALEPQAFADPFGNLACSVETAGVETQLSGRYVVIHDECGAVTESGSCDDGIDLGLKHGENCEVAPGASPGNTAAARTAYYHMNRIAEAARFYDSATSWLADPLTVNVNLDSACNANWDGSEINMFAAGSNCTNMAENPGVLIHEWAHGYDHNDGGGMDSPGEAYADITALVTFRDSCVGRGLYADGSTCAGEGDTCQVCTGLREFDWELRTEPHEPSTRTNWAFTCSFDPSIYAGPCRTQPHCESYIASETFYDLAFRDLPAAGMGPDSAWQLVERLWLESRHGSGGDGYYCSVSESHSCGADTWYQQLRAADDDDGDLSNGTPHAAEIFAAFDRHELACGAASDPENQSTSSCPSLSAPVLSATETASGTELSWNAVPGAAEYRVLRGEMGCNRQQVPIAALTGGETTYLDTVAEQEFARYYRVQVFGSNPACSSPVSTCEATSIDTRLQQSDHRVIDGGNGIPEPGETVQVPVTLFNTGAEGALSVSGTVQLVAPSQVRVLDSTASWATIPPGDVLESDTHFELVLFETASCGDVLTLEMQAAGANAVATSSRIEIPMGNPEGDFLNEQWAPIPPEAGPPVTSTLTIEDVQTIAELVVSLRVFHSDATQLTVELTSPDGTTVRLHDRTAGNGPGIVTNFGLDRPADGPGDLADFVGEGTFGVWTLSVQDHDSTGSSFDGSLNNWGLHFGVAGGFDCNRVTCPEPTPTEAPTLTMKIVADDLVLEWNPIPGVAGHHVLQADEPGFDAGVALLARTTTEASHTVEGGVHSPPGLTFFQVRATNSCNQEGP
jgi:subtilisin-like proprotein convertase family protein